MNTKLYYLGITIIAVMFAAYVYFAYLLFYPIKTLDIKVPIKVKTHLIKPGEDLVYIPDYCKYDDAGAKVYRTFVGETFIPTPAVETVTIKGCRQVTIHLKVPLGTPPGIYHLDILSEIKINSFRTSSLHFYTESFRVE